MYFTCNKRDLLEGVNAVTKAISAKTTIPILSGIYMEVTEEGVLRMVGNDMEVGIEYNVPLQSLAQNRPGATVVNARIFSEIIKKLPDTPLIFELDRNSELAIRYHGNQITARVMNAQESNPATCP